MTIHLEALDIWEAVEENYVVLFARKSNSSPTKDSQGKEDKKIQG
jgi:hypothetical protein